MMLKSCIKSMRLRTLPLSLAGVMMGTFIAIPFGRPSAATVVFLFMTTCCLQILSNISNELGDVLKGTDNSQRQGIHYSIQDGEMTNGQMIRFIAAMVLACCISGTLMMQFAFGTLLSFKSLFFAILGSAAIIAAMRYTLGDKPYGYSGYGDLFVFIFFGLVSTIGAFYISCQDISAVKYAILPAGAIGFFSVGVLNVNNIRDMKTDVQTRKTVALMLGLRRARVYQTVLICLGWLCMIADTLITASSWKGWIYLVTLPLYVLHLRGVWIKTDRELDPMLPLLVMSTFILSLIAGIGKII